MTGEGDPAARQVIVNELLASAQHAILTAKTKDEIEITFSQFYDENTVLEARNLLSELTLLGRRTARKPDKLKEVAQIIDCLQKVDWQGTNINFAAVDLRKVCHVASGIGDEMLFRSEINELRNKFENLTKQVEAIKTLSDTVRVVGEEIKAFRATPPPPPPPTLYSKVAAGYQKNRRPQQQVRRPVTPPISQQKAIERERQQQLSTEDETERPSNLDDGFKLVFHRKKKPVSVRGTVTSSKIRSAPKQRVGLLFATRFDPETDASEVEEYVRETELIGYKLCKVEPWNTNHNSYKSFKMVFELQDKPLSQFFKDMEKAEIWPEDVMVRRFNMSPYNMKSTNSSGNGNNKNSQLS